MPVAYERWQRREGGDRNDFALAAVDRCRRLRALPKVDSARFYWADYGSTLVVLADGAVGMLDSEHVLGNNDFAGSGFALDDLAHMVDSQQWADAAQGQQTWQEAGAPVGT